MVKRKKIVSLGGARSQVDADLVSHRASTDQFLREHRNTYDSHLTAGFLGRRRVRR